MEDFIFLEPEEEDDDPRSNSDSGIAATICIPPNSIKEKHLDEALKNINTLLYEDIIELWKVHGEC